MKFFNHGVLWMNARNLKYIQTKNKEESVSLADSKLKTKNFLSVRGIPFAETYVTISSHQELNNFSFDEISENYFVIKPNHGSKWQGILIVKKNKNGSFQVGGENWDEEEIRLHMLDILSGEFSLYGKHDKIVIEELLRPWKDFSKFCRYGLADIRIIVYNYVPITAMVRMPTEISGGKANLAQWWVGLGLNIASGEVMTFFQNKNIYKEKFPFGQEYLKGTIIPFWDNILLYSSQIQFYTGLGYLALDWVITKNGPKLLEINARAWLEIQNVNLVPLDKRLKQVDILKVKSPEKWVEIAKSLFHSEVSSTAVGKKIIHFSQKANIRGNELTLKVDPNLLETQISANLRKKITNHTLVILQNGTRIFISPLGWVNENLEKNTIILGQNDLKDCLISPTILEWEKISSQEKYSPHIKNIDIKIYDLGKKINLTSSLRPQNFSEELHKFLENPYEYNPQFQYKFPTESRFEEINILIKDLKAEIFALKKTHPIFAEIFENKLEEIENRANLVLAYKHSDYEKISQYNEKLFGKLDENLLAIASEKVFAKAQKKFSDQEILWKILSLDEIQTGVENYLKKYHIENIVIAISSSTFSRMAVAYKKNSVKINISANAKIRQNELPAILSHELWVHLRRYLNGKKTGLKIFESWTGFYLHDEEGLAVYKSLLHTPENYEKNSIYYNYYLAANADNLSFSQLAGLIRSLHPERSWEKIFSSTTRLKRWIQNTAISDRFWVSYQKDKIYLDGYFSVKNWVENWWDIEKLYFGKIKISDLPLIDKL